MSNPLGQIFRFILKLVMGLSAALIGIGLLFVALVIFALSLFSALIKGRRPASLMAFSRFQQFSQQGMWPVSPGRQRASQAATGQVVDVEVREISIDRPRP
ncbi:MAG: hypothetical protein JWP96_1598 [Polaromonas sp.]|nr:hypothetical protein [Polaromonas sp.]